METRTSCETEHDFALVSTGVTELTNQVEDALFEAGCSDATISVRLGTVYLRFARVASSLDDAVFRAIHDVRRANIGADVLRVDNCNLVTQAEIARRMARSRQRVHQYITGARGPGGFPGPVCQITEGTFLWAWCEVAYWLRQNNLIKEDDLNRARLIDTINTILDHQHRYKVDPEQFEELLQTLGPSSPG
jgi:hypothetical protein